ncbi:MAG: hypothetical protein WC956_02115 [bacterium]
MRHITIAVCSILCLFVSFSTSAKIKDADLQRPAVVTEEAALLSQVDAVSLYLSSDRVAYAPKLMPDKVIEVEVTVLSRELRDNRNRLQDFIQRQIKTFISTLRDRLPIYAPTIARSFNPDTDIAFNINEGPERRRAASYRAGQWAWQPGAREAKAVAPAPDTYYQQTASKAAIPPPPKSQKSTYSKVPEQKKPVAESTGKKGCNCPAMR